MKSLISINEVTNADCSVSALVPGCQPGIGAFILFSMKLKFGKYKGSKIEDLRSKEEIEYLHWLSQQLYVNEPIRRAIIKYLTR